jgi:pSer/pThr/pTyr-binding forkhead associated (FHA) protein
MANAREDPKKTIYSESTVGKRLAKVQKRGTMYIVFQGERVPIASRISLGRDPENSIVLEDVMASRRHAVIQKIKNEYFLEDLGSTNGTFLNGQPVPPGKYLKLEPADIVRIGRTELSLQHLKK